MLKGKRQVDDLADEEQAAAQLRAIQAAIAMLEEDEGQTKPLEKLLLETLCENSPAENAELARQYEEAEDQSLRRFVKKVFDDATEEALIALLSGPYAWYAGQLKQALTGAGRAPKEQVAQMVQLLLGHSGPFGLDESDGLAIAMCHGQFYGSLANQFLSNQIAEKTP